MAEKYRLINRYRCDVRRLPITLSDQDPTKPGDFAKTGLHSDTMTIPVSMGEL